ncbi:MAG: hypothetical protein LDLANPLL_01573 [Turneriella sp.]|nr:hypothetical protein [Turneriella sp.]
MLSLKHKKFQPFSVSIPLFLFFIFTANLTAAAVVKTDEEHWLSLGAGIRASFNAQEDAAANGKNYSKEFTINNVRLYMNAQFHKYIKAELNTDCVNCATAAGGGTFQNGTQNMAGNSSLVLLDAIGKFEFTESLNLWFGRLLLPSERGELSGPFYSATFDAFRTPLYPADMSSNFNGDSATGGGAGLYGRDNGTTLWGKVHPLGLHLLYAASISQGQRNGPNQANNLMYTGRLQINFLNDEKSPGYYAAKTYYGEAGNLLALGASVQHNKDAAGSATTGKADFTGTTADLLLELLMPQNAGVLTLVGEFKRFWAEYGKTATTAADCFCIFNGDSWSASLFYLIPYEIGVGKVQPYARYTRVNPYYSAWRYEAEYGFNYVIQGHNARFSLYGRYGDLATKGSSYTLGATGRTVSSFHIGMQLQY